MCERISTSKHTSIFLIYVQITLLSRILHRAPLYFSTKSEVASDMYVHTPKYDLSVRTQNIQSKNREVRDVHLSTFP